MLVILKTVRAINSTARKGQSQIFCNRPDCSKGGMVLKARSRKSKLEVLIYYSQGNEWIKPGTVWIRH